MSDDFTSSDAETYMYLVKGSEEVTRRNVTAMIDHGKATREIALANATEVQRLANEVGALRQMFQQQMVAFASTTQRALRAEAELEDALDRIAKLEAGDGDPD